MRRAPIYLLIDTSGSMYGEPIIAVQNGLKTCIEALRTDPESMEKAYVSIITFNNDAQNTIPLTYIQDLGTLPELKAEGGTSMGAAIELLNEQIEKDLVKNTAESKGDYKAFVLLLTDGHPTDNDKLTKEIAKINRKKIKYFIGAITPTTLNKDQDVEKIQEALKKITNSDEVIYLPSSDANTFKRFFEWVSQSASKSISKGDDDNHGDGPVDDGPLGELPPLPFGNDDSEIL